MLQLWQRCAIGMAMIWSRGKGATPACSRATALGNLEAISLRGAVWGAPASGPTPLPCMCLPLPPPPPPPPLSPVSQKVKAGVDSVEGCEATIFQVGGLGGLAGCTGLSVWKRGAGGSGACDRAVG